MVSTSARNSEEHSRQMASKQLTYRSQPFTISYVLVNPGAKKSLLILHGWGSNKEIMQQAFSQKFPDYRHIYVDMPGFGHSSNEMILTTKDYAQVLHLFLQEIQSEPGIIIGHSFGGKVATLLDPKCLVLLSSAGILTKKPWSVKLKIATVKFLKPLGMKKIRSLFVAPDAQGMSHEMYGTFKNVVNEDFESQFANYRSKALLFWGKEDTATPLWTAHKIKSMISDSKLYPLDGDHFFFLKHAKFIEEKILQECSQSS